MRADQELNCRKADGSFSSVLKHARIDDQTAVGPAPPLNDQRAEVARCRAEGEAIRIVEEDPVFVDQIDGRAGILNDRFVLDIDRDGTVILLLDLPDVPEGGVSKDRVGADPERRVPVRVALIVAGVMNSM